MADSANYFDAGAFMQGEGMHFEGLARPGVANVVMADGTKAELDIAAMLAAEGHKGVEIDYNSPETALQNQTPVGALDRLKLAFGNKKGGVEYLKKNYDGATVSENGQLLVKKGGLWTAVDPDGISDADGWSFNEIVGDVADLAGDAVLAAGQLIGAAAAGGATGGVAAAGGAVAGAAAASNVNAAMGRILGTYDATPAEYISGVAMDTLLAAAGEGVALGAKNAVLPAVKSMWTKVAGASEPSKQMMANAAKLALSIDDEAANVAFRDTSNFTRVFDEIHDAAQRPLKALVGDGTQSVNVAPGSFAAVTLTADNEMARSLMPLMQGAQKQASYQYTQGISKAMSEAAADLNPNAAGQVKGAVDELLAGMSGLVKGNKPAGVRGATQSSTYTVRPWKELQEAFRIDETSAKALQKNAQALANQARRWSGTYTPKGKAAVKELADLARTVRDLEAALPTSQMTAAGTDALRTSVSKFSNQVTSGLPTSLKNQLQTVNQQYARNAGVLHEIRQLQSAPGSSWEKAALTKAQSYAAKAKGDPQAQHFFDVLSALNPGQAPAAMKRVQLLHAAKAWRVQGDEGLWRGGMRAVAGPTLRAGNRALRSQPIQGIRRMAAQAAKPVTFMMSEAGKMLRSQGDVLNDPEKLGAALTMAFQGMGQ